MAQQQLAAYMHEYAMRGQHTRDRTMTRPRHDVCQMSDRNDMTTAPGRYTMGVPNRYGNAVFAPNPTIRQQLWGASHDMSSTKTDMESELWGIDRPSARICGQIPAVVKPHTLTAMPEQDFPMVFPRLVDPPCTLRGSGWNRWTWLAENPQADAMMPFEHQVDSRHAVKDTYYAQLQAGGVNAVAHGTEMICGKQYQEPAVPVARPSALNFSNAASGTAQ